MRGGWQTHWQYCRPRPPQVGHGTRRRVSVVNTLPRPRHCRQRIGAMPSSPQRRRRQLQPTSCAAAARRTWCLATATLAPGRLV